jgi:hypothetical protein
MMTTGRGAAGEDWGRMRVNRGLLGWGVFFIVLGSVPLAVRSGSLDPEVVRRAWQLWPLILIGIGLGLVLERTRLAVLGGLVVAVTFGLMGGAVLAAGFGSPIGITTCGFGGDGGGEPFAEQRGAFAGTDARVTLDMSCGEVVVTAADAAGWTLAGTSHDGLPPDVDAGGDRLAVRAPGRDGLELVQEGWRWDVALPRAVPLDLDLSLNAGTARVALPGAVVTGLDVDVNAGDARVDLGQATGTERVTGSVNAGSLSLILPRPGGALGGTLSVNAGSIELCVPDGVPLRLRMGDAALGSNNFEDRGLVRTGETWSTPGFDGSGESIGLNLSANLGSITLDPEDGCE